MEYQIVNLVASAAMNATLDLYNLAVSVSNIEYEPEQFPGAILKLKEPKVSMLLFKNGKVICSGASSEKEIELGIIKASRLIHEIQPKVKVLKKVEYTVVNLVATANLHQNLDLFHTALSLDNVEYEPEQFPGAILRLDEPKITLLLFKNGKVICAGAKKEEFLKKGLEKAAKLISKVNKGVKAPAFADEISFETPKPKKTVKKKATKKPAKKVLKKILIKKKKSKPKAKKKTAKKKKLLRKVLSKIKPKKPKKAAKKKKKKR